MALEFMLTRSLKVIEDTHYEKTTFISNFIFVLKQF